MEIKATTEYTQERLNRFNVTHVLRNKLRWFLYSGITVLFLIGVIVALVKGIKTDDYQSLIFYSALFLVILLLDAYMIFASFILPRIKIKKAPILGATLDVTFLDEGVSVKGHTKDTDSQSTQSYKSFQEVIKNGEDIYLYLNRVSAYIVDISQLSEEEVEQIKEKLTRNAKKTKWK